MLILKICNFQLIAIKFQEKSLSFNRVVLLLPKLLAKNLEPFGKHPPVLTELRIELYSKNPLIRNHMLRNHRLLRDNKNDFLTLNKTKIDEIIDDSLISIDVYFHERHDRNRHGGGVLIYIKDTITITYEILQNVDTKFVIIAWHRPPNYKIDDVLYIVKVYKTFYNIETEITRWNRLEGVNCDDLPNQDKNSIVAKLRGFYKQYQSRKLLKHPARTTDKSSTLLDHFATNKPNFITLSGSKSVGFSDDDLVFGI